MPCNYNGAPFVIILHIIDKGLPYIAIGKVKCLFTIAFCIQKRIECCLAVTGRKYTAGSIKYTSLLAYSSLFYLVVKVCIRYICIPAFIAKIEGRINKEHIYFGSSLFILYP